MPKNTEFHDYVVYDLMRDVPHITSRQMFGGWGIYRDGIIFAIITGGVLYFKTDDVNQKRFEEAGSAPFTYQNKGKTVALPYWNVPERVMEDPDELFAWIETSCDVARRR